MTRTATSVLGDQEVRWIASEWAFHRRLQKDLGDLFGLHQGAVSSIIRGFLNAPLRPHLSVGDRKIHIRQMLGRPAPKPRYRVRAVSHQYVKPPAPPPVQPQWCFVFDRQCTSCGQQCRVQADQHFNEIIQRLV